MRKYAVVGILLLAALVTPPDVITQLILFVVVYGLYEVSIFLVARVEKKREEKLRAEGYYDDEDEEPLRTMRSLMMRTLTKNLARAKNG